MINYNCAKKLSNRRFLYLKRALLFDDYLILRDVNDRIDVKNFEICQNTIEIMNLNVAIKFSIWF